MDYKKQRFPIYPGFSAVVLLIVLLCSAYRLERFGGYIVIRLTVLVISAEFALYHDIGFGLGVVLFKVYAVPDEFDPLLTADRDVLHDAVIVVLISIVGMDYVEITLHPDALSDIFLRALQDRSHLLVGEALTDLRQIEDRLLFRAGGQENKRYKDNREKSFHGDLRIISDQTVRLSPFVL